LIAHAKASKGMIRSNPIDSIHPMVRVHPVTGEKAIYYNAEFPDEVFGLKDQEAEVVTKFLLDFISKGHDFQARVHWEKNSVVMFDGRTTLRKSWMFSLLIQITAHTVSQIRGPLIMTPVHKRGTSFVLQL
jgi:alpha-ketoglutarate-dependent taurine dioxygenase